MPHETGAPARRIIHTRGLHNEASLRLRRLGLKRGLGYFKCGSDPQTDWITDFRVLISDGGQWTEIATGTGIGEPDDPATVHWVDLGGISTLSVLVELRRCAVDDWWPSWNIAIDGIILEGEMSEAPADSEQEGALTMAQADLKGLPSGISADILGGEVRYRTRFLEVGFRIRKAAFAYLALDDEGAGRTQRNLLQFGNLTTFHDPLCEYLAQGITLSEVAVPQAASYFRYAVSGTTHIRSNTVTYDIRLPQAGQTYHLQWEVLEDGLKLNAERTGERPLRAWNSSAWHVAFDSRVTPTVTLGNITRQGESGLLELPVLLHAPGHGSLQVHANGEASWRADSVRPIFTTTNELKIGEVAQPEGDYLLLPGKHGAEVSLAVKTPALVSASPDAPQAVSRMLRRWAVTGLPYRPDTATLSNNGNSMHAIICADNWSAITTRVGEVISGLRAIDLLRDTLERWLGGGQGYASGRSSHDRHLFEDEYVMSGTAALLGLSEYLLATPDSDWVARYAQAIRLEIDRMRERDLDGDGLVESPYRLGISGQYQWSTAWYDVISFGWKDAFSNALLHSALRNLETALVRHHQPGLTIGLSDWVSRLGVSYISAFMNPRTGWFGGWRSQDGALHDHAFLFVNGAAVNANLVDTDSARAILEKLWAELQRVGFNDYRLGLPGNLWKIPDADLATVQHGLPLGSYQNGGATHSQTRHFVSALYRVGMSQEADTILDGLAASMADATAFGGCGSGVDWRTWDGSPSGYEGLLCDQFGVLAPAIDRYGVSSTTL